MKNKYTFVCVMLCVILVLSYGFTSIYLNAQKQEKESGKAQKSGKKVIPVGKTVGIYS